MARGDSACGGLNVTRLHGAHDLAVTVRELDTVAAPARVGAALRTLARLLVRRHARKGDPVANAVADSPSSDLTVGAGPSVHHDDEAA